MSKPATQQTRSQNLQSAQELSQEAVVNPIEDGIEYLRAYAKEKPEMAALWCFGIGFVLGWKLKPW